MNKLNEIMESSVAEINRTFPEAKIDNEEDFVLFGAGSTVDSLALVSLIISLETGIERMFEKKVSLVNEDSFNMEQSPFETVGRLKLYMAELINGGNDR